MIRSFRQLSQNKFGRGFLLLVAASLLVSGNLAQWFQKDRVIMTIGEKKIYWTDALKRKFLLFVDQKKTQWPEQMIKNPSFLPWMLQLFLAKEREQWLWTQEAKRLGLVITDTMVLEEIAKKPLFFNQEGVFDVQKYRTFLKEKNISENCFIEENRFSMLKKLIQSAISDQFQWPAFYQKAMLDFLCEKRSGAYRLFSFDRETVLKSPSDETLKNLFELYRNRFISLEKRSFKLLYLEGEKDDNPGRLASLESAKKALETGEDWSSVCAAHGLKIIEVPYVSAIDSPPEECLWPDSLPWKSIQKQAFELERGHISQPTSDLVSRQAWILIPDGIQEAERYSDWKSAQSDLIALWKQQEQKKQAFEKAQADEKQIKTVWKEGETISETPRYSLFMPDKEQIRPKEITESFFELTPDKPTFVGELQDGTGYYVVTWDQKKHTPERDAQTQKALKQFIEHKSQKEFQYQVFQTFMQSVFSLYPHHISWDALLEPQRGNPEPSLAANDTL